MDLLLDLAIIWLSTSIFLMATGWYLAIVIQPRYPNWWQRVVVDVEPKSNIIHKRPKH